MNKKILIMVAVILILVSFTIYTYLPNTNDSKTNTESDVGVKWRNVQIKDILTEEDFKISDFSDKVILLESFAVWCPTCKKQQDEIKILHEKMGDSVISISLDTDPNEDISQVMEHTNKYDYDWKFAISPPDLTKSLINEFGTRVVSAPSAPIVLICKNKSARLLDRGIKSSEKLKSEIDTC